jgi:hypothetical protein
MSWRCAVAPCACSSRTTRTTARRGVPPRRAARSGRPGGGPLQRAPATLQQHAAFAAPAAAGQPPGAAPSRVHCSRCARAPGVRPVHSSCTCSACSRRCRRRALAASPAAAEAAAQPQRRPRADSKSSPANPGCAGTKRAAGEPYWNRQDALPPLRLPGVANTDAPQHRAGCASHHVYLLGRRCELPVLSR